MSVNNDVSILETNILHASDVVYWLDGTTGNAIEDMSRIEVPLEIKVDEKPSDLKSLKSSGKLALWRNPTLSIIEGEPTQNQRERPLLADFTFAGEVWDRSRRFNPARFSLTLGSGSGQAVIMYPSVLGTKKNTAGFLYGSILRNDDQLPLIWSLIELEVALSGSESMLFRAQTDQNGDFLISLKGLPPLPESINDYSASLTITANSNNEISVAPDLSSYIAWQLESINTADSYSLGLDLSIVPGQSTRINSSGKNYLAAQTV